MKNKLNNKGFTLVELLAVLVILVAIMSIAIPSISSSLERTKDKQNKARYTIIESALEQYITDNKNAVYDTLNQNGVDTCRMQVHQLKEYLSKDDMKNADDESLENSFVTFTRPNTYKFHENGEGGTTTNCNSN